jgi:phycobilisome rod-core linker protein
MSLPLLEYQPVSQNHRVAGFEVPNDEHPRSYCTDNLLSQVEYDGLINAAYRQIFHEQQTIAHHRQQALESQLRSGQITVKDFIQGLVLSDSFRRLNYDTNNNYRFAEMCVQRILGRNVYSDREKLAYSIEIATKGLNNFVADLVNSEEYLENFGYNTVPYQRRRILPSQSKGEVTFEHMARYSSDYRDRLPQPSKLGGFQGAGRLDYTRWEWQKNPPAILGKIGGGIIALGAATIVFMFLSILLGL